jgi:hypothetical protein
MAGSKRSGGGEKKGKPTKNEQIKGILVKPAALRREGDIHDLMEQTADIKFFKDGISKEIHKECCKVMTLETDLRAGAVPFRAERHRYDVLRGAVGVGAGDRPR